MNRILAFIAAAAVLITAGCTATGGAANGVGRQTGAAPQLTPISTMSAGCGPASVTIPTGTAVPFAGRYGYPTLPPLTGLTVALSDGRAAFVHPLAVPVTSNLPPLQLSILTPWSNSGATTDTKLILVFSSASSSAASIPEMVAGGGWIVSEAAAAGQDAARVAAALQAVGRADRALSVSIGPYPGTLVVQDPIDTNGRQPLALYWSDGTRDMSIQALALPAPIVDLARSFYC